MSILRVAFQEAPLQAAISKTGEEIVKLLHQVPSINLSSEDAVYGEAL